MLIAVIVLLFADVVKLIAMPALAGLLIVVGFQTIKPTAIRTVWQTGRVPRAVMLITFAGTLMMPLQYAVLLGVATSILLYLFQGANRIRLVELVPVKGGFPREQPVPRQLPSRRVTGAVPLWQPLLRGGQDAGGEPAAGRRGPAGGGDLPVFAATTSSAAP